MLDLALLKAEIECGLYKKPIEEIAKSFSYEPLPGGGAGGRHRGVVAGRLAVILHDREHHSQAAIA
jgi:hypothetical protein